MKIASKTIFILHDKQNLGSLALLKMRPETPIEAVTRNLMRDALRKRVKKHG